MIKNYNSKCFEEPTSSSMTVLLSASRQNFQGKKQLRTPVDKYNTVEKQPSISKLPFDGGAIKANKNKLEETERKVLHNVTSTITSRQRNNDQTKSISALSRLKQAFLTPALDQSKKVNNELHQARRREPLAHCSSQSPSSHAGAPIILFPSTNQRLQRPLTGSKLQMFVSKNNRQEKDPVNSSTAGRKTMLIYSTRNNYEDKVLPQSGSFIEQSQTVVSQYQQEEVHEELSLSTEEGGERLVINPSLNWGAVMNTTKKVMDIETQKEIIEPQKQIIVNQNSNLIYKSSPTKAGAKFQQFPLSRGGKSIQMFKPAKLSSASARNEDGDTPDKSSATKQEIQMDLTLDLSNKELTALPSLDSVLQIPQSSMQACHPTIINLSGNQLQTIPVTVFQLAQLRQLRLDYNRLTALPNGGLEFDLRKFRLQMLSLRSNSLSNLPSWLFQAGTTTLEKFDIAQNTQLSFITNDICSMEKLKILHIQGNNISCLPKDFYRLGKQIEELGLEWWQYLSLMDENSLGKKAEQGIIRDEVVLTNRQTLRQIFETLRVCSFYPKSRVEFQDFYRTFKRQYSEQPYKANWLFTLVCHFGHAQFLDQLLSQKNENRLSLNKPDKLAFGQTLLQVALHTAPHEDFILSLLKYINQQGQAYANFEVYTLRPNEEYPLQRQTQLLHPLAIALNRKMIPLTLEILRLMIEDTQKSSPQITQQCLSLDIRDENRNTLFHLAFALISDEKLKDQAKNLCNKLVSYLASRIGSSLKIELKLNEMNKQGMTPLDLALELRINEAVEFALQSNQVLLPKNLQFFDPNFNLNQRRLSPLHRAVQAHNHIGLFKLLQSRSCNTLGRDKDFKKARDYCQRMLFMQKLLKKAEDVQILQTRKETTRSKGYESFADIDHSILKIKQKANQKFKSSPQKQFKRCVSEIKETKPSNLVDTAESGGKTAILRQPYIIERPIPIERFLNLNYNRTVVEPAFMDDSSRQTITKAFHNSKAPVRQVETARHSNSHNQSGLYYQHSRQTSIVKPQLKKPDQQVKSPLEDNTSPGFNEGEGDWCSPYKNKQTQKQQNQPPQYTDFNTFIFDEAEASEESPTTFPSNKFHYVMTVNNSKLARKPYYKRLISNQFEPQFTNLLESHTSQSHSVMYKKLQILYYVFTLGMSYKSDQQTVDATDFFSILLYELADPYEGSLLKPLQNEIHYLSELLRSNVQKKHHQISCSSSESTERYEAAYKDQTKHPLKPPQVITPNHLSMNQNFSKSRAEYSAFQHNNSKFKKTQLKQSISLRSLQKKGGESHGKEDNEEETQLIIDEAVVPGQPRAAIKQLIVNRSENKTSARVSTGGSGIIGVYQQQHKLLKASRQNSTLEGKQLLFDSYDGMDPSPSSPKKGDSGQLRQKDNRTTSLKSALDVSSPSILPPSASDYSSVNLRKQQIKVLDSSIRTIAIQIMSNQQQQQEPNKNEDSEQQPAQQILMRDKRLIKHEFNSSSARNNSVAGRSSKQMSTSNAAAAAMTSFGTLAQSAIKGMAKGSGSGGGGTSFNSYRSTATSHRNSMGKSASTGQRSSRMMIMTDRIAQKQQVSNITTSIKLLQSLQNQLALKKKRAAPTQHIQTVPQSLQINKHEEVNPGS